MGTLLHPPERNQPTEARPTPTPWPLRSPVWPAVTRCVTVTHADGSETKSIMHVAYEPGTAPPPQTVRRICIRACRTCAAEPEQ